MKNKKAEFNGGHFILLIIIFFLIIFLGWWALTGQTISQPLDTDGDGLSDSEELEIGTNITNPNTDNDRYLDGEDKEPLKTNSANLDIQLIDKSWSWSSVIVNAISLVLKIGSLSSETIIADTHVEILIKNIGDDYSNYVNYDIIYKVADNKLRVIPTSVGVINKGEEKMIVYEEKILLKDIPEMLINSIVNLNTKWEIEIDNLSYEKFS